VTVLPDTTGVGRTVRASGTGRPDPDESPVPDAVTSLLQRAARKERDQEARRVGGRADRTDLGDPKTVAAD
jgi:hypothetical protein